MGAAIDAAGADGDWANAGTLLAIRAAAPTSARDVERVRPTLVLLL